MTGPAERSRAREPDAPLEALRDDALAIFQAALDAADPDRLVRRHLRLGVGGGAVIDRTEVAYPGTLRVVSIGKAAVSMARAAAAILSREAFAGEGLVVVNDENVADVERFRVLPSGHPLPDARGEAAGRAIEAYIGAGRREDGLLVLISGGASALVPAPVEGVTLEDKLEVTRLLLACGADIHELNTVRKHLSRLKGGGLARRAFPASVEALILSDVMGDDLSTIASGPTSPDPTTFQDAVSVLERRGLWERVPAAARRHLEAGRDGRVPETPKAGSPIFGHVRNRILGSNRLSLQAAVDAAGALGYATHVASERLEGEARDGARRLHETLEALRRGAGGALHKPTAILAGGETTVTVMGPGKGGRNQELALAFALLARGASAAGAGLPSTGTTTPSTTTPIVAITSPACAIASPWALLSGGTDGRDGPTDAAGAIVDRETLARQQARGVDPVGALSSNDAYTALAASGDLLFTGPTGTNVADIQVLLALP